MSSTPSASSKPVSLDTLIALNDEIAALVRAGVPLDQGLGLLGADLPGDPGRLAAELGRRLTAGATLPVAFEQLQPQLPPIYAAVVAVGLRCNRLPAALENVASSARRLREVRRTVSLAMLYPLLLTLLAYGFFLLLVLKVLPTFFGIYRGRPPIPLAWASYLGPPIAAWTIIFPVALVLLTVAWWWRMSRALVLDQGHTARLVGWVPLVGSLLASARAAALTETLGMLLECGVPFPDALSLAGSTIGDAGMARAAQAASERITAGVPHAAAFRQSCALPPLVRWLLAAGGTERTILPLIRRTAETYRRQMSHQTDWLRLYLPTLFAAVIGGGVTLLYTLSLFVPLTQMMRSLAKF